MENKQDETNNLWTEKYRPKTLKDYIGNQNKVKQIEDWMKNFHKPETPKVLLLSGPPGIGKTTMAHIILNTYKYVPIEFNSSDIRGGKNISETLDKFLNYHSVLDLFYGGKKPSALIMDEIDTLCQGGDKGGMTEFISLLKSKKDAKTKYLKISSPIICTFNDFNDKKLKELRGISLEVRLSKPTKYDLKKVAENIIKEEGMNIDDNILTSILNYAMDDYRRLINILYDIYINYSKTLVSTDEIETIFKTFQRKDVDTQIFDSAFQLLNKKQTMNDALLTYTMDSIMMPMMIHENYPKSLQNRKLNLKQKIGHAQNINNMLCYGELFQTEIYQHQYWDLLEFAGIGCLEAHKLASLDKIGIDEISYTSLMTSITTRGTNKKMLINMPALLNVNLNQIELMTLAEYIEYMLFVEQNILKVADILNIYNISPNDQKKDITNSIDNLLKVIRSSTENEKKLTVKIRRELRDIIQPIDVYISSSDEDNIDNGETENTNENTSENVNDEVEVKKTKKTKKVKTV